MFLISFRMFVVVTSFYQSFWNMSILLPKLFLICEKYYTLSEKERQKEKKGLQLTEKTFIMVNDE